MPRKRHSRLDDDQKKKKQKHHLVEYGEMHPINDKVDNRFESANIATKTSLKNKESAAYEPAVQNELDETEEPNSFTQLISIFGKQNHVNSINVESDDEDGDEETDADPDRNDEGAGNNLSEEDMDSEFSDFGDNFENYLDDQNDLEPEDMFCKHFENVVEEDLIQNLQDDKGNLQQNKFNWKELGQFVLSSVNLKDISLIKDLNQIYIKKSLIDNIKLHQMKSNKEELILTRFQSEMFSVIGRYTDLYYPNRTFDNGEDIRLMYTTHSVNHVLKTRSKIVHHNYKLSKSGRNTDLEYRDHGLTRPKVLIVVPFKESALRIVKIIENLLISDDKANIQNKKRFKEEFSLDKEEEERYKKKKISRPEDFEALFAGNIDDAFRVGLAITKKSLRLYADFYSSDIIVASPLGLRTIIGAEGEKDRDFDFLSSIEILIFDQTEVFTMQNWDHILHLMNHMHQQPKQSHGLDFSRVRMWCLNGWSKYYRQTLVFSGIKLPQITSLFNNHCHNYAGKVKIARPVVEGSINQVVAQAPHVYHRFEAKTIMDAIDERFNYFTNKILPQFKDPIMSHTMIFIPSYFDFIRVRNYMKREDMSITQICEYTKDAKISRARNLFFHNKRHFLLYTERFHFYRRYHIKGIRHIIFYELPSSPHFYSELCNFLHTANHEKAEVTCTVLHSKYDANQLTEVVGTDRATVMINSEKKSHMFVTGD